MAGVRKCRSRIVLGFLLSGLFVKKLTRNSIQNKKFFSFSFLKGGGGRGVGEGAKSLK